MALLTLVLIAISFVLTVISLYTAINLHDEVRESRNLLARDVSKLTNEINVIHEKVRQLEQLCRRLG